MSVLVFWGFSVLVGGRARSHFFNLSERLAVYCPIILQRELSYRQREVVVKTVLLQLFENQNKKIYQSSNPPKSGYNFKTRLMLQKFNLLTILLFLIAHCACAQPVPDQSFKRVADVQINGSAFVAYEGMINVPENYDSVSSRQIQLPIFIIKSSGDNPEEPVFWLDGGPGGSNIISRNNLDLPSAANTLKNHDFVCVGYRGVDGSVKLESKKLTKAFKGLDHKMLSDKSLNNIKSKIKSYNTELSKKGIDINQYNILDVIEDIETVRKQLRYNKINLLSVSYGTRIALLYSYKYPEIIKRTLMIGACPPGYFLASPEQAEAVLDTYDRIYREQDTSAVHLSIKDIMRKAFDALPARWSIYKLDADKIKAGTVNALYNVNFAVSVFDAYKKAVQENDYSGLFMLQKLSDVSHPKIMGDVYAKTVSADWENGKDVETSIRNTNTILGGNVSLIYAATSKEWRIRPIPAEYQKCQNSDVETVIISGSLDHRTPPSIVDQFLMPTLKKGKHIVLNNSAHVDILSVLMKNETFLQNYFDTGQVGQSALKGPEKVDFTPKIKISKTKIFLFGLLK